MNAAEQNPKSWRAALRRIIDSALGLMQSRFELFSIELQEEKLRTLNLLLWLWFALALATAGFLIGLGALALWLWAVAGYAGLAGLSLAALAGAAAIVWGIRYRIHSARVPFAQTIEEFRKDREWLAGKH